MSFRTECNEREKSKIPSYPFETFFGDGKSIKFQSSSLGPSETYPKSLQDDRLNILFEKHYFRSVIQNTFH